MSPADLDNLRQDARRYVERMRPPSGWFVASVKARYTGPAAPANRWATWVSGDPEDYCFDISLVWDGHSSIPPPSRGWAFMVEQLAPASGVAVSLFFVERPLGLFETTFDANPDAEDVY